MPARPAGQQDDIGTHVAIGHGLVTHRTPTTEMVRMPPCSLDTGCLQATSAPRSMSSLCAQIAQTSLSVLRLDQGFHRLLSTHRGWKSPFLAGNDLHQGRAPVLRRNPWRVKRSASARGAWSSIDVAPKRPLRIFSEAIARNEAGDDFLVGRSRQHG